MPTKLPEPIAAYFAATNAHDPDGMLAPFAAAAVVKDEGRTMRGRAAVGEWIKGTVEKYRHTVEVLGVEKKGARTIVTARVAGNFPGSPIELRYELMLAGGKISRLETR